MNKKNNVSTGEGEKISHLSDSAKQEKGARSFSGRFSQIKETIIGPHIKDASQTEALSKGIEKRPAELPNGVKDDALEEMKRVKEFYKEFVAIGKDTLDVGWKLAPLAFLPAGLLLWVYLRSIHWTGLFQDSAMSVSGLVFLFVAALLLAFAVLLQFVVPSVLLICTVSGYAQDRFMPKYVANIYRWALVGWLVGVSLIIWWDNSNGKWIALALPIVMSLIYLLLYTWKEPNLQRGWPSLAWFMKNAGWSLTATFTVAPPVCLW
jgi:hypothetical protein